jgi:hypothetical protein
MCRRLLPHLLVILAAALALGGLADRAAAQSTAAYVTVIGRVVQNATPVPQPVPCCDVLVTMTPASGGAGTTGTGRTRGDGTFSVRVDCPIPTEPYVIIAEALCCGGQSAPQTIDSCIDPATGGPRTVDVGDIGCANPPNTGRTLLEGSVVCRSGGLVEPVADCSILIERSPMEQYFTRTDSMGNWEACVACGPGTVNAYTVTAQCCDQSRVVDVVDCPERQTVDTFVCDPCPVPPCPDTTEIEVRGRVLCQGPLPPTPVPGCTVQITTQSGNGDPGEVRLAVTDANGEYTSCVRCLAGETNPQWLVLTQPQCCFSSTLTTNVVTGCPPQVTLIDDPCAPPPGGTCGPPACPTGRAEVTGVVTCLDPTGVPRPVADCEVVIQPEPCIDADGDGRCDPPCEEIRVFTDSNGRYSACVACPDCFSVTVTAACCGAQQFRDLTCTTVNVVDLDCRGPCPPDPVPCSPNEFEVFGRVTCAEGMAGSLRGVADCTVTAQCPGAPAVSAVTDANGFYTLCYPCATCPALTVTAECCGATRTITPPTPCTRTRADLDCGACVPPRPCPSPPGVEASGLLRCVQAGIATPIGGCPIVLTARDAAGMPLPPVTTVTNADGLYVECVPCGPSGLSSIEAQATCCDASTTTPVVDCPETAVLEPLLCSDCTPCPPGYTRLQGRVRCRGGGVVPDCGIVIVLETCAGGVQVYTATTDRQGRYRACVPCACPGTVIRVIATCCDGTRTVPVDDCGPITPVPTLFCRTPCR